MLNPQAERIYELLQDGNWHCPIDWKYSDGHGRRFTDINRYLAPKGLMLDSDWCDCGRHTTKIKKRKIIATLNAPHIPETYIGTPFFKIEKQQTLI